jgi:hypothetical protein
MKKLLLCFIAMMAVSGIAAADGVCINSAIDVTITPGGSFACGSLIFSDFYLTDLTGSLTGALDINSVSINSQGLVTLQENPNLAVGGSENLSFTVSGTLNSISLATGGTSASVTERVCANAIATSGNTADLCSNGSQSAFESPLGQLTVQSGNPMQQVAPGIYTAGPLHIFQTIDAGDQSNLGAIYEGFGDPPTTVPEPITFVLLGSALAFLGIAGRRMRKDKD